MRTAVLLTCYNRVNTTLRCIEMLHNSIIPNNMYLDIYLVDDNSPDETGKIIKSKYPDINIIFGTGNLYWNQGMRLAWENASKNYDYDFYLWLNDDTIIYDDALVSLLTDYENILNNKGEIVIVSGACQKHDSNEVTYGGRNMDHKLITPIGKPQECIFINGNFTLIPKEIYKKIGYLSNNFTHSLGDFDYGLRAIKAGFKCYISSEFVGRCDRNDLPKWQNNKNPFRERFKSFKSPLGYKAFEMFYFDKTHAGLKKAVFNYIGNHIRLLSPSMWNKIRSLKK